MLRRADATRVVGLALHGDAWTCVAGDRLETRAWPDGKKSTVVDLGFAATAFAHAGDRIVVTGARKLASFAWKRGWSRHGAVAITGDTLALAIDATLVARAVPGPPGRGRRVTRDRIELRDATTLKPIGDITPTFTRGTASVAVVAGDAYVGGHGNFSVERYAPGKKRPSASIRARGCGTSPVAASGDGAWLAVCSDDTGVELYDVRDGHRELAFDLLDPDNPCTALGIAADGARIALGSKRGHVYVVDRDRLGAVAVGATGATRVWQPARCEVAARVAGATSIAVDPRTGVIHAIDATGGPIELDASTGGVRTGSGARPPDDIWLGGERWLGEQELGDHVCASADGVHFAVAEGRSGGDEWRRWNIFGADLATPVRAVELPEPARRARAAGRRHDRGTRASAADAARAGLRHAGHARGPRR